MQFVGALIDSNPLIRSAARKTLQLTKLQKLVMFRSSIDNLLKNLELYPQVCSKKSLSKVNIHHSIHQVNNISLCCFFLYNLIFLEK